MELLAIIKYVSFLEEKQMVNKTSSTFPDQQGVDLSSLSFEERLQLGAENAVRCMGITSKDRVFIMADYQHENIARRVALAALNRYADVSIHFLEHYGIRPLTTVPDALCND